VIKSMKGKVLSQRFAQGPGDVKGEGMAALSEDAGTFLDAGPLAANRAPGDGTRAVGRKVGKRGNCEDGHQAGEAKEEIHAPLIGSSIIIFTVFDKINGNHMPDKPARFRLACTCSVAPDASRARQRSHPVNALKVVYKIYL
jgi:hypothetical protein